MKIRDERVNLKGALQIHQQSLSTKKKKVLAGEPKITGKKQSLHEHKINILTEFTNITNHKTYLFEQTAVVQTLRGWIKGTSENTNMLLF